MRLLIVTHEYPPLPGGAGVGVRHLAEELARRGHDVTVVTAGPVDSSEAVGGVSLQRVGCGARPGRVGIRVWVGFLARAAARVRAVVSHAAPQAVLSFFPVVGGTAVVRARIAVPHVATFVGADIHDPTRPWVAADGNPLVRSLTGRVLRHAAAITAGSSDMIRRIEALYPGRTLCRVPLGVPPMHRLPRSRADLGLREGTFVMVSVCRLVRRKRLDVLLDAAAALETPVEVVLVGDGPAADELRERAARLGMAAQVHFPGVVDEARKAALLAAADLFCLPSAHEAFGLAIVEALSLGLPVVTTEGGGQADIVRDGVEGFLVPVGQPDALARRLAQLAEDRGALARMGEAAAERARAFTPAATADGFLEILRPLADA